MIIPWVRHLQELCLMFQMSGLWLLLPPRTLALLRTSFPGLDCFWHLRQCLVALSSFKHEFFFNHKHKSHLLKHFVTRNWRWMRQSAFLEAADSHTQSLPWGQFSGSLFCSPLVSCGASLHPPHMGPLRVWMLKTHPGTIDLSIYLPRDTQL